MSLSAIEIKAITDERATLLEELRSIGATALNPTPEWNTKRKQFAVLNKKLSVDAAAKRAAVGSAETAAGSQP